jgi:AbrB family looped-hinge helix DNA binding protein
MVSLFKRRKGMTITMTSKNQVTIPKKIVDRFNLKRGAIFDIKIDMNKIELIPMELVEKSYTEYEYKRLEELYQQEKHTVKPMSKDLIKKLKQGKI